MTRSRKNGVLKYLRELMITILGLLCVWNFSSYNGMKGKNEQLQKDKVELEYRMLYAGEVIHIPIPKHITFYNKEGVVDKNFNNVNKDVKVVTINVQRNVCQECVESILSDIERFKSRDENLSFVVLTDFRSYRGLSRFIEIYNVEIPVFITKPYNSLSFVDIQCNSPYLFYLDFKKNVLSDFFLPDKHSPDLTYLYLNKLSKR